LGNLYQIVSTPLAHPASFANERDMETFLAEHRELLAEHLVSGEAEGQIVALWRQWTLKHAPEKGGVGRLDLIFVLQEGTKHVLYIAELKNESAGVGAVEQTAAYLEAWAHPENAGLRKTVADHMVQRVEGLSEDKANTVANVPYGLVVAPGFLADAVNGLVAWSQKHPDRPIQALKLFRFRLTSGQGHAVFVDDTYVVPRPGAKRVIRWSELHEALPDLVPHGAVFVLDCGGRRIEATPDFIEGRGKNFLLAAHHVEETLRRASEKTPEGWHQHLVPRVANAIRDGRSVPMTPLTGFLFWAYGGGGRGRDSEVPAPLWSLRDDPQHRTVAQLDGLLK
jgi:hypothetical protein